MHQTHETDVAILGSGLAGSVAALCLVRQGLRVTILDQRRLTVEIDVDEDPIERRFGGLPVIPVGTDHAVYLDPPQMTVVVSGPPGVVRSLEPDQIRLIVDLANLEPGPRRQSVELTVRFEGLPPRGQDRLTAIPSRESVSAVLTARKADDG